MKRFLFLVLIFLLNCSDSSKAIDYNNQLISIVDHLIEMENKLSDLNGEDLDKTISQFKNFLPEAKKTVSLLPRMEGDEEYRAAVLDLIDFYTDLSEGKLQTLSEEELSEKEAKIEEQIKSAQLRFSKKYNFQIEEIK
jgi:hypothetical protein